MAAHLEVADWQRRGSAMEPLSSASPRDATATIISAIIHTKPLTYMQRLQQDLVGKYLKCPAE